MPKFRAGRPWGAEIHVGQGHVHVDPCPGFTKDAGMLMFYLITASSHVRTEP